MKCERCNESFEGEGELCERCLLALKLEVIDNSVKALERLQMDMAIAKNQIQKCRHDFGQLRSGTIEIVNGAYGAVTTVLADINQELDILRPKRRQK